MILALMGSNETCAQAAPPEDPTLARNSVWTKVLILQRGRWEQEVDTRVANLVLLGRESGLVGGYKGFWNWRGFGLWGNAPDRFLVPQHAKMLSKESPFGVIADNRWNDDQRKENPEYARDAGFPVHLLAKRVLVGLGANDSSPDEDGYPEVLTGPQVHSGAFYCLAGDRRLFLVVREAVDGFAGDDDWSNRQAGTVVLLHQTQRPDPFDPLLDRAMRGYWDRFYRTGPRLLQEMLSELAEAWSLTPVDMLIDLSRTTGVIRMGQSDLAAVPDGLLDLEVREGEVQVTSASTAIPTGCIQEFSVATDDADGIKARVWAGRLGRFVVLFEPSADLMVQIDTRL